MKRTGNKCKRKGARGRKVIQRNGRCGYTGKVGLQRRRRPNEEIESGKDVDYKEEDVHKKEHYVCRIVHCRC
jgi:hypothetical protein